MSLVRRIEHAADLSTPHPERAIAVWFTSGIEWGDERRIGRGDLNRLTQAFGRLSVPADLIAPSRIAATRIVMVVRLGLPNDAVSWHVFTLSPNRPETFAGLSR